MATPEQYIEALEEELATYERLGKDDRAAAVKEQLKIARKAKSVAAPAADLSEAERKRVAAEERMRAELAEEHAQRERELAAAAEDEQKRQEEAERQRQAADLEAQRAAGNTTPPTRPGLNGTTEDWRNYAKGADLGTPEDAGRDAIVAAYIEKNAPSGSASKEDWVQYAKDHGIEPGDQTRDEIRKTVGDAGWAPPVDAGTPSKRTTQDSTPRQKRG